jgi:AraC family transcriptional regulator, transcriptional activator of pobA
VETGSSQEDAGNNLNYLPESLKQGIEQFKVFRLEDFLKEHGTPANYDGKGLYKISLIRGRNRYHYADKSIEIEGNTLMFFNPRVPYTWESLSGDRTGYFCIFQEAFFSKVFRSNIHQLPMFKQGGRHGYSLTTEQNKKISGIFRILMQEMVSSYPYKYDLIRNYITQIIHLAMKIAQREADNNHWCLKRLSDF